MKYDMQVPQETLVINSNRLTNQLWKLIPMRENNENWKNHLQGLIVEISGLSELCLRQPSLISLLSKLEGLLQYETEFALYRKIVFETISLLRDSVK